MGRSTRAGDPLEPGAGVLGDGCIRAGGGFEVLAGGGCTRAGGAVRFVVGTLGGDGAGVDADGCGVELAGGRVGDDAGVGGAELAEGRGGDAAGVGAGNNSGELVETIGLAAGDSGAACSPLPSSQRATTRLPTT